MKQLLFALAFFGLYVSLAAQPHEKDYQLLIQQYMGGQMEVSVQSGRVDLLTEEYAIEIEFANKWKQSIGQALWYGLQTNKTPGIILIKRDGQADNKYVIQLGSALSYAGISNMKVWVWPDDFPGAGTPVPQARQLSSSAGEYWLNMNGNKRHNRTCSNFNNTSRGRFCTATEGVACGNCGG
jgi:hypothetical protein